MRTRDSLEREPGDMDDEWPLDLWFSREEAFSEDDTWHAGRRRRVESRVGRAIRSVADAWHRVPRGGAGHTRIRPVHQA